MLQGFGLSKKLIYVNTRRLIGNQTDGFFKTSFAWQLAGQERSFLMELSLFSKKTVETPYATFHEESELYEA